MCLMYFTINWNNTDVDCDGPPGGLPIHYYLTRSSNIDLDIVKQLVANPEVLQSHDGDTKCTPINIFMHHKKIGEMDDVLQYLAETNPSSLLVKNRLDAHPDSVSQVETEELALPLHRAASDKSPAFCKFLVDAYPESVRRESGYGLPFHYACQRGRIDTVEYLHSLYPECINIRGNGGWSAIHYACIFPQENAPEIVEFILRHDSECLSKPVDERFGAALPLHSACPYWDTFPDTVKLLFDLYPEAILIKNESEQLPVDIARANATRHLPINPQTGRPRDEWIQRKKLMQEAANFFSTQMNYARQAQDESAMRTTDSTGSLPLHNAIRAKAPLGSIKLLVKGNLDAVNVPDGSEMCPLDIAIRYSKVDVVKYLAELSPDCLKTCDVNKCFPLHHACRGGNCKVTLYLLETPMSSASVSERNVDGMFPIHLFYEYVNEQEEEGDNPEYTETIWRLLTSYPETVLNW